MNNASRNIHVLVFVQTYVFISQGYIYIYIYIYQSKCKTCYSLQLCLTLCDSMDCGPPGSSVHGILQARILEWVARPSQRIFPTLESNPIVSLPSPALAGRFFTASDTWKDPSRDFIGPSQVISSKWCVSAQTAGKDYSWSILPQEPSRGSLI